jgi:cytoskeleton protein RodZ
MVEQRGAEPLEPRLGDGPVLREVGAPAVDETPSLCVDLRLARMAAGRELPEVAAALRIQLTYLTALEEGRFDDLPGATYASGFLRTYSEYLGLDSDEMVARLKRETTGGVSRRDLAFPVPPKEGRNPKPWLILAVLAIAGLAYGGWHVYSNEGEIVANVSNTLTEAAGLSDDEAVMAEVATEPVAGGEEPETGAAVREAPAANEVETVVANAPVEEPAAARQAEQTASADPVAAAQDTEALANDWASNTAPDTEAADTVTTAIAAGDDARAEYAAGASEENAAPRAATADPLTGNSLWDDGAGSAPSAERAAVEQAAEETPATAPIIANANARAIDDSAAEKIAAAGDAASEPAREPNVYGEENSGYRVSITATADSWVQVQGPDNELLLTRILRTGDSYRVPNRSGLTMVTGNAGALQVFVDGKAAEPLGPIGVVRRNISLDPESLLAGTVADID